MKKIRAFSLAELMIVMLILTIILAATMPILSKRAKVKAAAAANVSLPIKNEGDTCTTGSIAIGSDGTLLTCQGSTFKKPPSAGGAGQVLYLYQDSMSRSYGTRVSCPSGWTQASDGIYAKSDYSSSYDEYLTTCYKCS